jgi:hypothetical protein
MMWIAAVVLVLLIALLAGIAANTRVGPRKTSRGPRT